MPPADLHLRADAQRNRDAVIAAAIGLLGQRPDASMQEIAAASGVGRTTVYRHFPAREDLVRGIFAVVIDEARAIVVRAIAEGGPAAAVLRRLGPEIVGLGERYRFLEAHRELVLHDPLKNPAADEPLLRWLTEAHARGELHAAFPPDWAYAAVHGLSVAANDEVVAGRRDPDDAGRLLGDTLVQLFAADS